MMKNGDKDLINSIPLSSLKSSNFNISAIPAANLPDSFVINDFLTIIFIKFMQIKHNLKKGPRLCKNSIEK